MALPCLKVTEQLPFIVQESTGLQTGIKVLTPVFLLMFVLVTFKRQCSLIPAYLTVLSFCWRESGVLVWNFFFPTLSTLKNIAESDVITFIVQQPRIGPWGATELIFMYPFKLLLSLKTSTCPRPEITVFSFAWTCPGVTYHRSLCSSDKKRNRPFIQKLKLRSIYIKNSQHKKHKVARIKRHLSVNQMSNYF